MQQQWIISWSDGDVLQKVDFMQQQTTSDDRLSCWTEKKLQSTFQSTFQSPTCTKNRSWPLFGGLLLVWSATAFWIPVKPLHLWSVLSKSMRHSENCKTCSQHWSRKGAQFFSTTTHNHTHNQHFKSWTNWTMKFRLIYHIHPLTSTCHILRAVTECINSLILPACRLRTHLWPAFRQNWNASQDTKSSGNTHKSAKTPVPSYLCHALLSVHL